MPGGGTDEKPFKCSTDGCGQSFTNEDHLTVHRFKHQMSLTLSPGGNKFHFPDQTPTPTKFLRYGEEIGLFSDIKNPFDDAFKSASENIITEKVSTPLAESIQLPHTQDESDTLNTPTPHMHMVHNDTPPKKRYRAEAQAMQKQTSTPSQVAITSLPIPGPPNDHTGKEVVHSAANLKRERFSASSSQYSSQESGLEGPPSHDSRASVLELDDDLVEVQEYPAQPVTKLPSPLKSPQYKTVSSEQERPLTISEHHSIAATNSSQHTLQNKVIHVKTETKPIAPKRPHSLAFSSQPVSIATLPTFVESTNQSVSSSITVVPSQVQTLQSASITSTGGSQYMIQMMIQTADGKVVPMNIPAIPATNTTPNNKLTPVVDTVQPVVQVVQGPVQPQPVQQPGGHRTLQPLMQQPLQSVVQTGVQGSSTGGKNVPLVVGHVAAAPVATTLVTKSTSLSTSGHSNASLTTKQRLKAAIQQNSPIGPKAFSVMSPSSRASSTSDSNPSTPLGGPYSVRSYIEYQDADSSVMAGKDVDLDSSGSGKGDDDSHKRKRFLERNRAAAYRCRAKKKEWVRNLEKKAEDLQATNTRLQNEVSHLRAEMAQLKALLLAHKDCPITAQQRNAGQLMIQRVGEPDTSEVRVVVPSRPVDVISSVITSESKLKVTNVVSLKPCKPVSTMASTLGQTQFARVPTTYHIHNEPKPMVINTPMQQLQPVLQPAQVLAVDLSSQNLTQFHTIGKS